MTTHKAGRAKHIPQRVCVVCKTTSAKRSLIRLVKTAESGLQIDPTGKLNGRGAYLCDDPACWQKAIKSDIVAKALRTTLSEADRQCLQAATPSAIEKNKDLAM
jgi:uncharacterized protein